ncbi:hypothetical protein GCM10027515_01080 [Schumannella luteola]|uniref:Large extracellular alpha-helical protein n=1 Tax=Schumannella luteola TaxID=472059 RepID=A0A852YA65_9MICO|nr:DUF5719 family protein [Schumannella luteola]NYG98752.1 hypothetical protein [Schumannella luteola]TPX04436.1 hypothetical protein FJ656_11830 [Schumannella luteola]
MPESTNEQQPGDGEAIVPNAEQEAAAEAVSGSADPKLAKTERSKPERTKPERARAERVKPERVKKERPERTPVDGAARRRALAGLRATTGGVGVLIAAAAIAAVGLLPLPSFGEPVAGFPVTPERAELQQVCPGAVLRLGDDSGQDAGTASAVDGAVVRESATAGDAQSSPIPNAPSTARVITADPADDALLSGAQSQRLGGDELSGFAAASCREATSTAWLVGGSTAIGRTTLITLSNPTGVEATVALDIWGENGAVSAPGMTGIVVPPDSQRVLSLAGFAQNLASPMIEVVSRGGQVVAALQQSITRGVDPGGVELIGETAAPATKQTIPGVQMPGPDTVGAQLGEAGYADLASALRLGNPGTVDATVDVSIVPEQKGAEATTQRIPVAAGTTVDVPIEEQPAGGYTVSLESDAPVVGAMRTSVFTPAADSASAPATDFAWSVATTALGDRAAFTTALGDAPTLHLVNPTSAAVSLVLHPSSGVAPIPFEVPARGALTAVLVPGASYAVEGGAGVHGAVTYRGASALAGYAIASPGPTSGPITIRR